MYGSKTNLYLLSGLSALIYQKTSLSSVTPLLKLSFSSGYDSKFSNLQDTKSNNFLAFSHSSSFTSFVN
jgi:hypothetical protein